MSGSPYTIIKAAWKKIDDGVPAQPSLFERPEESVVRCGRRSIIVSMRPAGPTGWSNRLIAGDSLLPALRKPPF
jgi:hypothetical protein